MSEFEKVWQELIKQRAVIVAAMKWYQTEDSAALRRLKSACARMAKSTKRKKATP